MKTAHVTPAYGRDYTSKKTAEKDWNEGKDFVFHNPGSPWDGRPCNLQDIKASGYTHVQIRYKKNTQVCVLEIK